MKYHILVSVFYNDLDVIPFRWLRLCSVNAPFLEEDHLSEGGGDLNRGKDLHATFLGHSSDHHACGRARF